MHPARLWQLAGSDLFVLADRTGRVVALHTASPADARDGTGVARRTLNEESPGHWWFGGQHLYEVFLRPIYFGPPGENRLLGFLVIGYEIDDRRDLASKPDRRQPGGVLLRRHRGADHAVPVQEIGIGASSALVRSASRSRPIPRKFNSVTSASSDYFAGTGRPENTVCALDVF